MTVDTPIGSVPSTPVVLGRMAAICFAKKGEFVSRNVAGETILVPIRGRMGDLDNIYNMSEVGSFIWNQIDGATPVLRIVDGVCTEFDVAPDTAASDALEFIAHLQSAGLIEPRLETEA